MNMQMWREIQEMSWCECGDHVVSTQTQLNTIRCILSIVAAGTLAFKHQSISIHNADDTSIALDRFQTKILQL